MANKLIILFDNTNAITSHIDPSIGVFRQGDVGHEIYCRFVNFANYAYGAYIIFERADGSKSPELPMTLADFTYSGTLYSGFKLVIDDEWIMAQDGSLKATVRVRNASGTVVASGLVPISLEKTVYDESPDITVEQYNALLAYIESFVAKNSIVYPHILTEFPNDLDDFAVGTIIIINDLVYAPSYFNILRVTENAGDKDLTSLTDASNVLIFVSAPATNRADLINYEGVHKTYLCYVSINGDNDIPPGYYICGGGANGEGWLIGNGAAIALNSNGETVRRSALKSELTAEINKFIDGTYIANKATNDSDGLPINQTYAVGATTSYNVANSTLTISLFNSQGSIIDVRNIVITDIVNLKSGELPAKKAEQDANGNIIMGTYETKADALSKIINNLNDTSTDKSLSAYQGKVLKGYIDALNALVDSDDVNLDTIQEIVAYIKENKSLIESITINKVNVSDIIDNLTSAISDKPLSAKQGYVLDNKIMGSMLVVSDYDEDTGEITLETTYTSSYDSDTGILTFSN